MLAKIPNLTLLPTQKPNRARIGTAAGDSFVSAAAQFAVVTFSEMAQRGFLTYLVDYCRMGEHEPSSKFRNWRFLALDRTFVLWLRQGNDNVSVDR